MAYAITCHKAQRSSAQRVIILIQDAANVDVSWIYTAVTRAEVQAVLVGRRAVFDAVMRRAPA